MLKLLILLSAVLLLVFLAPPVMAMEKAAEEPFFANPLNIYSIGDPFILPADGRYYLFATGGNLGFNVWESDDLRAFGEPQVALKLLPWATGSYWAPEVYHYQGRYVMLYSVRWKQNGSLRVGIAFADQPQGPYQDPLGGPLLDLGYAAIDASLFVDADGTPYLYYSRDCSENVVKGHNESHVYGVKLSADLLSLEGEPVLLTVPDAPWELQSGDWRWNEGPCVIAHQGRYYLFYSANMFSQKEYAVGAAVGSVEAVRVSGPGHNSFFRVGDELFNAYHTHSNPKSPSGNRRLNIDSAGFHADGTAYLNGPVIGKRPLPEVVSGLKNHIRDAQTTAALLQDGDCCFAPSSDAYVWRGQQADFAWETPVKAELLLLYPAQGWKGSGSILINGEQELAFDLAEQLDEKLQALQIPLQGEIKALSLRFVHEAALGELMLLGPIE